MPALVRPRDPRFRGYRPSLLIRTASDPGRSDLNVLSIHGDATVLHRGAGRPCDGDRKRRGGNRAADRLDRNAARRE